MRGEGGEGGGGERVNVEVVVVVWSPYLYRKRFGQLVDESVEEWGERGG